MDNQHERLRAIAEEMARRSSERRAQNNGAWDGLPCGLCGRPALEFFNCGMCGRYSCWACIMTVSLACSNVPSQQQQQQRRDNEDQDENGQRQ